jgi:hypothetical protein
VAEVSKVLGGSIWYIIVFFILKVNMAPALPYSLLLVPLIIGCGCMVWVAVKKRA